MKNFLQNITLFLVLFHLSHQNFYLEEETALPHSDEILSADISNDGTKLVSAIFQDSQINMWDVTDNFSLIITLQSCKTYSVSFSNDNRKIISANDCGSFVIWDIYNNYSETSYGNFDVIYTAYFTPNDQYVILGCNEGYFIWDQDNDQEVIKLSEGHSGGIHSCQMSSNSSKIATGNDNQTVKIWELNDAQDGFNVIKQFEGHTSTVKFLRFSPDSSKLVSACNDKVLLWDLINYELIQTLDSAKLTANFSNDGKYIIAGCTDYSLKIWELNTGDQQYQLVNTVEELHINDIYFLKFSRNDLRIITSSADGNVKILKKGSCGIHFTYNNLNTCQLCSQSYDYCQNCKENECQSCFGGFYLDQNSSCQSCQALYQNCEVCALEGCQKCYQGFYLDENSCKFCDEKFQNCLSCQSEQCFSCVTGYFLEDKECQMCSSKFSNCESCYQDSCYRCEDGYYLDGEQNNTCQLCTINDLAKYHLCQRNSQNFCQQGSYLNEEVYECVECQSQCKSCDKYQCQECFNGYFLNKESVCESCSEIHYGVYSCSSSRVFSCLYGFYLDYEEGECRACYSKHELCQSCNNTKCFACYLGYYLDSEIGECINCQDKYENCQICSQDQCIACLEGKSCDINNQVQEDNIELTDSQKLISMQEKVRETDEIETIITLGVIDFITILLLITLMVCFCRKYKQLQQKNQNIEKSQIDIQNCFGNLDEYQKVMVYEQFHKKNTKLTCSGQIHESKGTFLTKSQSSNSKNNSPTINDEQQTEIHTTDVELNFHRKITLDKKK